MPQNFLKKLNALLWEFARGRAEVTDTDTRRRLVTMSITALIMILASLFWAVMDWYSFGRVLQPAIEVTAAVVGLLFFLGQRRIKSVDLRTQLFVGIISVFLLLINFCFVIRQGVISSNTPWLFLIPLISFFISGIQDGLFWSFTTLAWLIIFGLLGHTGIVGELTDLEQFLDLLSVYLLIFFFSFLYERVRQQMRFKLKEAKEFSEDIVEHAPLGIYTVSKEGIIESVNPAMEKISHVAQITGEKTKSNVFEIKAYQDAALTKFIQEALRTGKDLEIDNLMLCSPETGRKTFRHYYLIPLRNNIAAVKRLLLLVEDVTSMRDVEAGREILIQELSKKNEDLERFVYVVSHDLRSPLTSLRGYLDEIRDDVKERETQQLENDLQQLDKIAINMGQMIDDLLALSRVGKQECQKERVDVSKLVAEVLDTVSIQLKEKKFKVEIQPVLPHISVFRRPLKEIFGNLIANAIKFRNEQKKPRLKIGCREREDEYHFFVRDNGIGISPENQKKLFTLFFRYGKQQGTGVGLSIVKEYTALHNGRVWVESKEGKGSKFWFSIPKN